MAKSLLLNNNYDVLSFISERKTLRLLYKQKVEVISEWVDEDITFVSGETMKFPAVIRLKYYVHKKFTRLPFSRRAVFKRDKYHCEYCGVSLKSGQATIDHIVPKALGGGSSFTNCVASCFRCNSKKGKRTAEQAQMFPMNKPVAPNGYVYYLLDSDRWHKDWNAFLKLE